MNLSSLMFWKKKSIRIDETPSTNTSNTKKTSNQQITNSNIKNFVVKAVGFTNDNSNGDFASPEYDLSEIKSAIETDSYINLATKKYSQLIFKAGYNIVSDNDAAAEYIKSRLRMMSFMTGTPTNTLLQGVAEDIVRYSNAFLVKSRVEASQLGGIQAVGIRDTKPIGGYFRVDPTTIQIKRDTNGTVQQYQQESGNESATFKSTDVTHFYIDKDGGAAFGTPRLIAALEDVKMLRKIEGNTLDLIYRFAIPIYQMKIGIPETGMMATDKEIDDAKTAAEKMASDGIMVTNERTEFIAIGAQGEAIDLTGYLSYFEKRVFSALNMSEAMMGRGGAKQDADSMEAQIHDTVKFIQQSIATFIENDIFNELLLEGGFNPITNEQDIVKFQFNEINLETKVKMATNVLNQYQGNAITFAEMRKQLGLDSDSVDTNTLYANLIQQKNALELVQAKLGNSTNTSTTETNTTGSTSSNTGTSGPDKQQKTSGAVSNAISPTNQHGTTSVNIKETYKNIHHSTNTNIENYKNNFKSIHNKYHTLCNDICQNNSDADIILPIAKESIFKELKYKIQFEAQKGITKAIKDVHSNENINKQIVIKILEDKLNKTLNRIFKDIKRKLKTAKTKEDKVAVFDSIEYRLRFLSEEIVMKSYWFAYVKTCSQLNIQKVFVRFSKTENNKIHNSIINTRSFSLEDIPPYNVYCTCKIELNKKKKVGDT